jgi:hypothetical protein
MDPDQFHDLLDRAVAHEPSSGTEVSRAVAAGERRLRRRRWAAAASAATAVLAIGCLSVAGAPGLGGADRVEPAVDPGPPSSEADLLDSCRNGNQGDADTASIFGSGTPTVKAVSRNPHQVMLAIESADGQHWAECFIHLETAEFASGMTVYDRSGRSRSTSYSSGGGCGLVAGDVDSTCTTFVVSWVDLLPSAVSAVRFDLYDGTSPVVESRDGYIVLNHRGENPGGPYDVMGMPQPIDRVTYLDDAGEPIAAEAFDGSGSGPDRDKIDGLPRLRAFPSLRADDTRTRLTS